MKRFVAIFLKFIKKLQMQMARAPYLILIMMGILIQQMPFPLMNTITQIPIGMLFLMNWTISQWIPHNIWE